MRTIDAAVLFLVMGVVGATTDFDFQFGNDIGQEVYIKEGVIPLLHPDTTVFLDIPPGIDVTFVRVTVNALASPKVEYDGTASEDEELVYIYVSFIPAFQPYYYLNVTVKHPLLLEKNISHLNVTYSNIVSKVDIKFDPAISVLSFYVILPFIHTPFEVQAFSTPINTSAMANITEMGEYKVV